MLPELVETCRSHGMTDIVTVHEHRGEPDGLVVSHLPYGPTAYFGLFNVVSDLPYLVWGLKPAVHDVHPAFHRPCCGCGISLQYYCNSLSVPASRQVPHFCKYCRQAIHVLQVTRHDIGDKSAVGTLSEAYPHLIFEHFGSQLGQRVLHSLQMLSV